VQQEQLEILVAQEIQVPQELLAQLEQRVTLVLKESLDKLDQLEAKVTQDLLEQ
jgi:hypothetical protein